MRQDTSTTSEATMLKDLAGWLAIDLGFPLLGFVLNLVLRRYGPLRDT